MVAKVLCIFSPNTDNQNIKLTRIGFFILHVKCFKMPNVPSILFFWLYTGNSCVELWYELKLLTPLIVLLCLAFLVNLLNSNHLI